MQHMFTELLFGAKVRFSRNQLASSVEGSSAATANGSFICPPYAAWRDSGFFSHTRMSCRTFFRFVWQCSWSLNAQYPDSGLPKVQVPLIPLSSTMLTEGPLWLELLACLWPSLCHQGFLPYFIMYNLLCPQSALDVQF